MANNNGNRLLVSPRETWHDDYLRGRSAPELAHFQFRPSIERIKCTKITLRELNLFRANYRTRDSENFHLQRSLAGGASLNRKLSPVSLSMTNDGEDDDDNDDDDDDDGDDDDDDTGPSRELGQRPRVLARNKERVRKKAETQFRQCSCKATVAIISPRCFSTENRRYENARRKTTIVESNRRYKSKIKSSNKQR
ncbi:hypothetical protein PUN28_004096 [Cardiocondyla obscurior]|uniref:Uncharacterized protein n=1 Tax=Cardiocondyla obscurior TaxID=286306 RepID=A0AAW2GPJ2_9HYME